MMSYRTAPSRSNLAQEDESKKRNPPPNIPSLTPKAIQHTYRIGLPSATLGAKASTSNTSQSTQNHKQIETFKVQTTNATPYILTPSNFIEALATYTEMKTKVPTEHNPHIRALKSSVDSTGVIPTDFCNLVRSAAKAQTVKLHDSDWSYSPMPKDDYRYYSARMAEIANIASAAAREPGTANREIDKIELELDKLDHHRREPKAICAHDKEKKINTWEIKQCKEWVHNNANEYPDSIQLAIKNKKRESEATWQRIKSKEKEKKEATKKKSIYTLPPHAETKKSRNKLREYQQKVNQSSELLESLNRKAKKLEKDSSNLNNWKNYQIKLSAALKKAENKDNGEIKKLNVYVRNTQKLNTTAVGSSSSSAVTSESVTVHESQVHQSDKNPNTTAVGSSSSSAVTNESVTVHAKPGDRLAELITEFKTLKIGNTAKAPEEEIKRLQQIDTSLQNSLTRHQPQITSRMLKGFKLSVQSPVVALGLVYEPKTEAETALKKHHVMSLNSKKGTYEETLVVGRRTYTSHVNVADVVENYHTLDTTNPFVHDHMTDEKDIYLPDTPEDNTPKDYSDSLIAGIFDLPDNVAITNIEHSCASNDGIFSHISEAATIKDQYKGKIISKIHLNIYKESDSDSD
ncbi:hypothetical protein HGG78_12530 [Vibrio aestuarianus]|uniref:hypothetical protein n=1 Tax=Vibrio aestuarianus TaxID=28171 RepID=UPI00155895CA|nr:hypothetical protein [Vibrio aestuarianus]NGZ14557.1 hypothetical protein [Vibrio aestuarianus]NKZ50705.1 hypothetical protein [Vibrio aestuarianus]